MASKYAIETVFRLIDNITAPLDKIGVKGKTLGNALKTDFIKSSDAIEKVGEKAEEVAKKVTKAAAKMAAATIAAGAAAATAFAVNGIKDAMGFEKSMEQIGARANLTKDQIKSFSNDLINLSNETGAALSSLTDAQLEAISKGVNVADSVGFVEVAVKAAQGGFTDTTTVIDGLTSVLKSYGLEATAAAGVSDQMMAAAKAGGVSFGDMASKLEKVLPVAAKFGVSSDQLFASIATMTSQGVPIADAAKKIKSALEKDGARGIFDLTNGEKFNDILGQIQNSAGATQGAFDRIDQTTSEKFGSMINKIKNTGVKLGTALLPAFNSLISKISVFADKFSQVDFGPLAAKVEEVVNKITNSLDFDAITAGIGRLIGVLAWAGKVIIKVAGLIWKLRAFIMGVAIAWGIYKAAQIGALVVSAVMGMVRAVQTLMAAQQGMNAAQAIFNVLLNANPIGLIITAVGVLIGLIILAVTHWKQIIAVLKYAWEWIKYVSLVIWDGLVSAFSGLTGAIAKNSEKIMAFIEIFLGPFGFVISMIYELIDSWDMVVNTFKTDGIIAGIKRLAGVLISGLMAPVQGFLEMLSKIPIIGDKIAPAAGRIADFRAELKGYENDAEASAASGVAAASKATAGPRPTREKPDKLQMPGGKTETPDPILDAAPADITSPAPMSMTTSPMGMAAPVPGSSPASLPGGSPRQPAMLDLSRPMQGQVTRAAPAAISAPMAPQSATAASDTVTRTIPPAMSPAAPMAPIAPPRQVDPVIIPVKYDFPALIVPADLIKQITIPVQFAFLDLPGLSIPAAPVTETATGGGPSVIQAVPPELSIPAMSPAVSIPAPLVNVAPPAIRPAAVNVAPPETTQPIVNVSTPMASPLQAVPPAVNVPAPQVNITPPETRTQNTAAAIGGGIPRQIGGTETTTPSIIPAEITAPVPSITDRLVPPAAVNTDPAGLDRMIPASVQYPVTPSVGEALVPPAAPMTRAEQSAAEQVMYQRTENRETITIMVSPEEGTKARVVNPPKTPNIRLEVSGAV